MSQASLTYVIGLGANLGDRRATLKSAVSALQARGRVASVSHLYETEAVGPPQPDYFNAAVLLQSMLNPRALLEELLVIEREHGRERRERWGPRSLDLDLLYCPELLVDERGLTLPHPELHRRAFALLPLLDVAPDARQPRSGAPYADLLASVDVRSVQRVAMAASWCELVAASAGPGRTE